jgi:hypothetical protein
MKQEKEKQIFAFMDLIVFYIEENKILKKNILIHSRSLHFPSI